MARYSEDLDKSLAGRYERALTDPELLSLNDSIALVDAYMGKLLSSMKGGDAPPPKWEEADELFKRFKAYRQSKQYQHADETLEELGELFDERAGEANTWDEIFKSMDQRRKLADSERKRRMDMKLLLDAEKVMDIAAQLLAAVHEACYAILSESKAKRLYLATAERFARITGSRNPDLADRVGQGGALARSCRVDRDELLDT